MIDNFNEPAEETLKKAFVRLVNIDSRRWIQFLLNVLPKLSSLDVSKLSDIEQRMMQMFYVSVFLKTVEDWNAPDVSNNLKMLSDSTVMLHELTEHNVQ